MATTSTKVGALLRELCILGDNGRDARENLVSALSRVAHAVPRASRPIDLALRELSKWDDFPWVIGAVYWSLRRKDESLPAGTIFTPPSLTQQVVSRLLPDLGVVDLGAGTGMLTLTAAKRGFRVTAIELDQEMSLVLDSLARILKVRDRIDLRIGDALMYQGGSDLQIMANPPYTRHHLIPAEKKSHLARFASNLGVPLPLSAGHHAYFMIYAWSAEWSEREVLLLPTNWLDAKYGRELWRVLVERGLREIAVVQSTNGKPVFENALTTACLITTQSKLSHRKRRHREPLFRVVRGQNAPLNHEDEPAERLVARLKESLQASGHVEMNGGPALEDVFSVKRGVATGANWFFVYDKSSANKLGLPANELRPIVKNLTRRTTPDQLQFLWIPREHPSAASQRRITQGEALSVNDAYLCKHRQPWWRIKVPEPPSYFLSYMWRIKPTIKANRHNLLHLNNIHGLYLADGVSLKTAQRVVDWLRSDEGIAAIMNSARHYEGGLWKIEPGDMERLRLPSYLL